MRRFRRLLSIVLLLAAAAGFASGCLNGMPLDEYSYVMSIGVDVGITRKYYVSFLIQLESSSQQSETGQGEMVLAAEGDSLFEAIRIIELTIADQLNFMRTNYIAFSQDVAKTQLMNDFLNVSLNGLGIRRSVKLFITLTSANEYFKGLNSPTEPSVAKRQLGMYHSYEYSGLMPITNLSLYREAVSGGRFDVMLPTGSLDTSNQTYTGVESQGTSGKDEYEQSGSGSGTTAGVNRDSGQSSYPWGCAIFNGETLVGILNGSDTQLLLMANGQFKSGLVVYKNEESQYAFTLEASKKPDVKVETGEFPKAEISIVLTGRVESDTAGNIVDVWESRLKREFEGYLEAELERVFLICRDMGSDVLGLGCRVSMQYTSTRAWEEYDWKEQYKKMEVQFRVKVKPENTMITESKG